MLIYSVVNFPGCITRKIISKHITIKQNINIKYFHFSCNCLTKLCELVIEIIYELCKCCDNDNEGIIGDIKLCEIRRFTMNILHILNFKYYNLIEKYLHSCSQFKVILHILQKWSKHMSEEDCKIICLICLEDIL